MAGKPKPLDSYPPNMISKLGVVNDYELANEFGVSQKMIWYLRKRLNIPSYLSTRTGIYKCPICNKQFKRWKSQEEIPGRSGIMYCSRECQWKSLDRGYEGKYGHGWERQRKLALKREDCCRHCGNTENLQVHHIIPYRISKSNSLDNLMILCRSCHTKEDSRIRRAEKSCPNAKI